jgi:hypothetical protein
VPSAAQQQAAHALAQQQAAEAAAVAQQAALLQQQQQQQQQQASMVGYKMQYYLRGQWLTGVICDYQHPNIIVTFGLGTPNAFDEVIKWCDNRYRMT